MRLYIIRHAEPDYANDTITPAGHMEASALSERLATEGITRVFCSPLGRARDTMRYTAERLGLPWQVEDWTREIDFGAKVEDPILGRVCPWDLSPEVIFANGSPTWETWWQDPRLSPFKPRERIDWVRENSDGFLARLGYERDGAVYKAVQPNQDKVAVFCHNGFGLTWLSVLLQIPSSLVWAGFWLPPSSVTTILFDERSTGTFTPRCIGMADVSHLHHAGLPVKPAGIWKAFH